MFRQAGEKGSYGGVQTMRLCLEHRQRRMGHAAVIVDD
jgi:hypothetical protein